MPARACRPLRRLVVALAAVALLALWRQPVSPASVDAKDILGYPVGLRHSVTAQSGGFSVHGISQGEKQWSVAVGEEDGDSTSPLAVVQKLNGEPTKYAVTYDSDKSSLKPKLAAGVEGIRFSATGSEGEDLNSADWALRVRGPNGNHFSATTDEGEVVYEGTYTHEEPVADGLSALYAVDMKRRQGDANSAPSWVRHGLGLRYASELGDFKVNVHQPSPDGPNDDLEFEATYSGDLAGPPGSPSYSMVARSGAGESTSYEGKLKLKGPTGVSGGLTVGLKDGKGSVAGFTDLSTERQVGDALKVSAATRVEATPEGGASLRPIDLVATADLAALLSDYMGAGSEVSASARYQLGEEKPALSAKATLKPKPLGPLHLSASGRAAEGEVTGTVGASARVANVAATYAGSKAAGQEARHVGQAVFPAEAAVDKSGRALPQLYGRVTQSGADHDGKPRVQVGMMYDFNTKDASFSGQSNLFDTGDQLVDEEGKPWPSVVYNQAKNTAKVLRERVRGGDAEGTQWLRKLA